MRGGFRARWIFGGAALAAVTYLAVDAMIPVKVSPTLVAERQATRREGIPVFTADLQKPIPPMGDNAAVIYDKMPSSGAEKPSEKSGNELYSKLYKHPTTLTDADWQQVRKTVADLAPLLKAVHAAASKPTCVFNHDWTTTHPEAILFPDLAKIRRSERELAMESLLMAHEGRGVAAVQNAQLGFRLAEHAGTEPCLIGYLVEVAVDSITISSLQNILRLQPNDSATLNAIQSCLEAHTPPRSLRYAIGGEIAFEQTMCETIRNGGPSQLRNISSSDGDGGISPQVTRAISVGIALRRRYWNGLVDANALAMLRYNRAVLAVCDAPYTESKAVAADKLIPLQGMPNPNNVLAAILLPVESGVIGKRASEINRINVAKAATAVLSYCIAHQGALPNHLSDAMKNAPANAFDGKPLMYEVQGTNKTAFTISAADPSDKKDQPATVHFSYPGN